MAKTKEEKAAEKEKKVQEKTQKKIEKTKQLRDQALENYQKEQQKGENVDTKALEMYKDNYEHYSDQIQKLEGYKKETPEERKLTLEDVKETFKDIPSSLVSGAKAYASNFAPMTEEEKQRYEEDKLDYAKTFGAAPEEDVTEEVITETPVLDEIPSTPEEAEMKATEDVTETPSTITPEERNSFDWRSSPDNLGLYANAMLDSIAAGHKRRANQAVALSGFAGPYGSTQKPFSEEEATSPFEKIKQQTYENYLSSMRNKQDALNNVERTDIKNKYKSVYDIDAKNTAERQAYITQTLGSIQNQLNVDLNRSIMSMKKEELKEFVSRLQDNLEEIASNIDDEGIINGLKQSIPLLMKASLEGNLESALLNANVNAVGNAATSLGGGLASFIGNFIK